MTRTLRQMSFVLLATLLWGLSSGVKACSGAECFFFNVDTGVAMSASNQSNDGWTRLGAGWSLNDHMDVGINGVYLGGDEESTLGADMYIRGLFPAGDRANLYVETGVSTFGNHLNVGAGLQYGLTAQVDLDIGYQYYGQVTASQGDMYTFGVGLQYHFAPHHPYFIHESPSPQVASYEEGVAESPRELVVPAVTPSSSECSVFWDDSEALLAQPGATDHYTIRKGDWAIKIAQKHCTNLKVLMELNPWLVPRVKNDEYIFPEEILTVPAL